MSDPAPRILTPQYYRRLKVLEEQHPWTRAMRRWAFELLKPQGIISKLTRVLDAGCGAGLFLLEWSREFSDSVAFGFDLSLDGLRVARGRGLERLAAANVVALPVASGGLDVVVLGDVLQHLSVHDAPRALEECARVLRPGGLLLIRTAGRRGIGRKKHLDTADYQQWEPGSLRAALAEQGLAADFLAAVNCLPSLWADLRAFVRPRPQGDTGLTLQPSAPPRWKSTLLEFYWELERFLILRMGWRPSRGHTLFCVARKRPNEGAVGVQGTPGPDGRSELPGGKQ